MLTKFVERCGELPPLGGCGREFSSIAAQKTHLLVTPQLMGNMAGLDHAYLNKMSLILCVRYFCTNLKEGIILILMCSIATRVLYNQIYINQTNSFTSYMR